jgi:flavin reductase (DIM6/NTAB) family NADH-FMN oxidoreductase RutF
MDTFLRSARECAINYLASDQAAVATVFADATKQTEQRALIDASGVVPTLSASAGHLVCTLLHASTAHVGDHAVWFGRVTQVRGRTNNHASLPLVYHGRQFGTLDMPR